MKQTFSKVELTTILQSLENELRITEDVDEQDKDSKDWACHLRKVIEKITIYIQGGKIKWKKK